MFVNFFSLCRGNLKRKNIILEVHMANLLYCSNPTIVTPMFHIDYRVDKGYVECTRNEDGYRANSSPIRHMVRAGEFLLVLTSRAPDYPVTTWLFVDEARYTTVRVVGADFSVSRYTPISLMCTDGKVYIHDGQKDWTLGKILDTKLENNIIHISAEYGRVSFSAGLSE